MTSRQMWFVAAMMAVVASVTVLSMQQAQGQAGEKLSVAVVDVQGVFQALKERGDIEGDITGMTEKIQQEEQKLAQELKALENDLTVLAPDSEPYRQTKEKLEMKAIYLQSWKGFQKRQLENEKTLRIEGLYNKVVAAVARIAEQKNLDLVLHKDDAENLRAANQQQLVALIQVRKVLFNKKSLDITEQVTQLMNNEYVNKK
ncbi:MAG: hypothetical protein GC159_02010 [Phycisphaera sp.]|nr:hypothetical protein [Phycisphaera sp.]